MPCYSSSSVGKLLTIAMLSGSDLFTGLDYWTVTLGGWAMVPLVGLFHVPENQ